MLLSCSGMEDNPILSALAQAIVAQLQGNTGTAKPEPTREQKLQAVMEYLVGQGEYTAQDDGTFNYSPPQAEAKAEEAEAEAEAEAQAQPEANPVDAPSEETAQLLKVILGGQAPTGKPTPGDIEDESLSESDLVAAYNEMLTGTDN